MSGIWPPSSLEQITGLITDPGVSTAASTMGTSFASKALTQLGSNAGQLAGVSNPVGWVGLAMTGLGTAMSTLGRLIPDELRYKTRDTAGKNLFSPNTRNIERMEFYTPGSLEKGIVNTGMAMAGVGGVLSNPITGSLGLVNTFKNIADYNKGNRASNFGFEPKPVSGLMDLDYGNIAETQKQPGQLGTDSYYEGSIRKPNLKGI